MEIIKINKKNICLVNEFVENANYSLKSFRYFEKRKISTVLSHISTFVLIKFNKVIGYCHLEKENDLIWLGIAIINEKIGMGFGEVLVKHLIKEARSKKIKEINLSVDKDNIKAIGLYEKFGFILNKETKKVFFYKYNLDLS
jgi:ribosomal protein S18 acetylase RimI-like enzyme